MRLGPRARSACVLLELAAASARTGAVAQERYAALVDTLEAALDGDPEPALGPLRRRMAAYAAEQRYEQAAGARDRLEALTRALAEAAGRPPGPAPTRSCSPAPTPTGGR